MYAYYVSAVFVAAGGEPLEMVLHHAAKKGEVKDKLNRTGWDVKVIRGATMEDIAHVPRYEVVVAKARGAAEERRREEVERKKREEAEQAARAAAAIQAAEALERQAEELEREAEERTDRALSRAASDVFNVDIEPQIKGNVAVATMCSKVALFFNQASMNKRDVFTSVSLDFAGIEVGLGLPRAVSLMRIMLAEMNEYLRIESAIFDLGQRLAADRVSVESRVNAIGSRTHVFGGSGGGLFISMLAASSAANADEREARALVEGHQSRMNQVKRETDRYRLRQQLSEFRVKTAASLLLVACGKERAVHLDMPPEVETYVLGEG